MVDDLGSSSAPGLKRFRAGWFALLAAIVIALYLCWMMLRPFVEVPIWAAVLVIVFYPFHQALLRRSHKPTASAALSTAFVVGVILVPLALLTVVIVDEAGEAVKYLSNNWAKLVSPDAAHMKQIGALIGQDKLERLSSKQGFRDALQEALQAEGLPLAGATGLLVGNALAVLLKILFAVFTMFYLFRDGERVIEMLRNTLPLDRLQSAQIFHRTREVINASLYGVLVIAVIQGTMGGLAFWALGLPSPLLWGAVMTLLSTIPLVGSTVVWIPTAIYLALTGHWGKGLALALWGGVAISSVDNFLRPRLVGGRTRLHELLVFFSIVGGLQAFGILGIVIGPVVVAITLALLDVFRKADRPAGAPLTPTLVEAQAKLRDVPGTNESMNH